MKKTNWIPLFSTNFIGVLNDNFLKNLICFIGILWVPAEHKSQVIGIATALMVLPFILFSSWAGKLSKEHSKAKIIQIAKLAEIPIMIFGAFGFYIQNIYIVMIANLLMGFQACMFSPSKYGIIRDIGGREKISYGTGAMEMFTFLGVLIGTASAGFVADLHLIPEIGERYKLIIFGILVGFAITGWAISKKINPDEGEPDLEEKISLNPITFTYHCFKWSKSIKGLNFAILGLGFFWMIASLLQLNMIIYCPEKYHLSNTQTSMIMASLAIGIGLGSYIAGVISKHTVKTFLSPIGGIGMGICTLSIFTFNLPLVAFVILIIVTAFFAGLYKVPLNAFLQDRVKGRQLGLILGYNNISDFIFILISSAIFSISEPLFGSSSIFLIATISIFLVTTIVYFNVPDSKFKHLKF